MRILLVNKFLYPRGGAETYIFKLGGILESQGHEVEYFGLADERNIVGNRVNSLVESQDFQSGILKNLIAPFKIIYSVEARKKIRNVLTDFKPDVVHMNNIQFHLTPSIILEIEDFMRKFKNEVKIVYTAHDFQLICPSHGLFDNDLKPCDKCLGGNYLHCIRTKCVKNSRLKSILGACDAYFWKHSKAYSYIDTIVCPSEFMKKKLDKQKRFSSKTVAIHNFVDKVDFTETEKSDYVLEFGKLCEDKGTYTLLEVCKRMPNTKFVFAGYGPAVEDIKKLKNAEFVGFKSGEELEHLIRKAAVSVCPTTIDENCSFAVIESQMYMTPVIGSRKGGTPELIKEGKTGELFNAGDDRELEEKIRKITDNSELIKLYSSNCKQMDIETSDTYYKKIMKVYCGEK